jgi:hypothetical protein
MVRLLLLSVLLSLPAFADEYLVAAQDLPAGSKVTMDVISQRRSKMKLLGAVKNDSASMVVHQTLMVPLKKGDLLMWFAFSGNASVNERCNKSGSPR